MSMLQMISNSLKPEWAEPSASAPFVIVGEPNIKISPVPYLDYPELITAIAQCRVGPKGALCLNLPTLVAPCRALFTIQLPRRMATLWPAPEPSPF